MPEIKKRSVKDQDVEQNSKPHVPVSVGIIAGIMVFISITSIFALALFDGKGKNLTFIEDLWYILIFIGLIRMRRWSLYAFTGLVVFSMGVVIYFFATDYTARDLGIFIPQILQIGILVYLWTLSKKFV